MTLGTVAALAYGILAIAGGVIGYKGASSKVSLVSGTITGLLLVVAGIIQIRSQSRGLSWAAIITSVLVVFLAFRLAKTRKFMPAGLMTILGMVALTMIASQLLGR